MNDAREDRINVAVDALDGILPAAACHKDLAGRDCVRFTNTIAVSIREMATRVVDALT